MSRYVEVRHEHPGAWQFVRGEELKPFAKMIGKSIGVGLLAGLPATVLLTIYWWR